MYTFSLNGSIFYPLKMNIKRGKDGLCSLNLKDLLLVSPKNRDLKMKK